MRSEPERPASDDESTRASVSARSIEDDDDRTVVLPAEPDVPSTPGELLKEQMLGGGEQGPARVGRYVVLRLLGQGGMGVVFSAYDEELGRKVAIKLLSVPESKGSTGRVRMDREARVLARLSHQNVVQVYDVGEYGGQLFLAMEFVEGGTLRDWLAERERGWRAVLQMIIGAGHGLAAAHTAGIIHRDFKPQNVMVGEDGRARVLDFGLAKQGAEEGESGAREGADPTPTDSTGGQASPDSVSFDTRDPLSEPLTKVGTLLGTPRYMSPEQHFCKPVTARSDQFSFCVVLYEALFRQRAYAGENLREYRRSVCAGQLAPLVRSRGVPAWLRRIVVRGLSPKPEDRWPSMEALLAALSRDPQRMWRRVGLGVALAAGASGVTYAVVARQARIDQAKHRACQGAAEALAPTWGEQRRESLHAAFAATELSYASDVAARVSARLDGRADEWISLHSSTCEAHQRGELSDELLDLRMACLEDRRREMSALLDVLDEPTRAAVDTSIDAVGGLRVIDKCADPDFLHAVIKPPDDPVIAAEVTRLRGQLDSIKATIETGGIDEGREVAKTLLAETRALGHAPMLAEALFMVGYSAIKAGEHREALDLLSESYEIAIATSADYAATKAACQLLFVHGGRLANNEAAAIWAVTARGLTEKLDDDRVRLVLANQLGVIKLRSGEREEAEAQLLKAIELHERLHDGPTVSLGHVYNNLTMLYSGQKEWAKSEEAGRLALTILSEELGPGHPQVSLPLTNLATTMWAQGRLDEGLDFARRSVDVHAAAAGKDHPLRATLLINLGAVQQQRRDFDDARETYKEALAIHQRVHGPHHLHTASVIADRGDLELKAGNFALAEKDFRDAMVVFERTLGPDSGALAYLLSGIGQSQLGQGDARAAVTTLERALKVYAQNTAEPSSAAAASFGLARALWELGEQRERAITLTREAQALYEVYRGGYRIEREAVAAWLAAREAEGA